MEVIANGSPPRLSLHIAILPDTDQFGPQARAQINKDLASIHPDVGVGANLSKSDVNKIVTQLKAIARTPVDVGARLNKGDVAKIVTQLQGIGRQPVNVGVSLDKAAAARMAAELTAYTKAHTIEVHAELPTSDLGKMAASLDAYLKGHTAEVGLQLNPAQLAKIKATLDTFLKNQTETIDFNILPALAKVALLKKTQDAFRTYVQSQHFGIDFNILPALAKIAELKAAAHSLVGLPFTQIALAKYTGVVPGRISVDPGISTEINNINKLNGVMAAFAAGGAAKLINAQRMITLGSGAFGAWSTYAGAKIALFGHALDRVLPSFLRSVSAWHLGADVILEIAAAWIPATIAVGIFAAAAYPTAKAIYGQWQSINTVLDSVGGKGLPDVGKGFDTLAKAVKPSVMIAFGDALLIAKNNTGPLATALQSVGKVFDNWAAQIVQWAAKGLQGFAKFVQSGSRDLAGLGDAFVQVGRILGTILHALPGYVHLLLALGDAFLKVTANVLSFLAPVLKIGLALHGAILYIGLAATALIALGRSFTAGALAALATRLGVATSGVGVAAEGSTGKIRGFAMALGAFAGNVAGVGINVGKYGKSLWTAGESAGHLNLGSRLAAGGSKLLGDTVGAIGKIPLAGWALAAAAAIGGLLYLATLKFESSAQRLGDTLVSLVQNSNPNTLFTNTTKAIGLNIQAVEKLTTGYQNLAKTQNTNTDNTSALYGSVSAHPGGNAVSPGGPGGPPGTNTGQYTDLAGNFIRIANAALPAAKNVVAVAKATGGMSNALNIASLAGIKWSDINKATPDQLKTIITNMQGYAAAVQYMSQSEGQAASNVAALNFVASQQYTNVQKLNNAWTTFLGVLQGGEAAFIPLEQGINQYNNDLKAAGASMTGLNPASLQLRSDFLSVSGAANNQIGALTQYSAVTSGATDAQKNLAEKGIKAVIAQLIPLAGHNATARASVIALAQRANGSLTTWQAVTRWVGRNGAAGAARTLQDVNGQLAQSMRNVAGVANQLTGAVTQLAVATEAKLVFALTGSAGKMTAFGNALASSNGKITPAIQTLGVGLYNSLVKAGVGADQAKGIVLSLAKAAGTTNSGLQTLTNGMNNSQAAMNKTAAVARNLSNDVKANATAFENLNGKLGLTKNQAAGVWGVLAQQNISMVSGKATSAKTAFVDFAMNALHLTSTQANALWNTNKAQNLVDLAGKANTTKASFINFAMQGLHLTSAQANTLWTTLRLQYLDTLVAKGNTAKASFIDLAKNAFGLTTSQANALWTSLKNQYLDTLATKAGETKLAFEKTAAQFGLTKIQADQLWGSLNNLRAQSPVTLQVLETLSGQGSISATVSAAGIKLGSAVNAAAGIAQKVAKAATAGKIPHHAAGWQVPAGSGPSGHDSHLAVLAPGELVIPTSHAASFGAAAKRAGVPGLASGGTVGGSVGGNTSSTAGANGAASSTGNTTGINVGSIGGSTGSTFNSGGIASGNFITNAANVPAAAAKGLSTIEKGTLQFTADAMSVFATAVNSAFQAAQAAAAAAAAASAGIGGAFTGGINGGYLLTIARYLMANGLNRSAAAGVAATISGESGGNPESRNCVPLTYKVVTDRGILAHDEVRVGDKTIGYNLVTQCAEAATILDVPYHYGARMVRIGNDHWSVECTNDHKWITAERGLVRADRLLMGEEILLGDGWLEQVYDFEDLGAQDSFCLTTTTGTWTVLPHNADEPVWTGNSGGWGLIGWTGNVVGLPSGYTGPTGNVNYDMGKQLQGVIGYANARGGIGALNAAGNPVAAGDVWSRYEAPLVPLSDTRPAEANYLYAQLGGGSAQAITQAIQTQKRVQGKVNQVRHHSAGGVIPEAVLGFGVNSGIPYSFAEHGPEYVSPTMNTDSNPGMPPATNYGQQTTNQLLRSIVTLLQQQPQAMTRVQQSGLGAGMRRGSYSTGG